MNAVLYQHNTRSETTQENGNKIAQILRQSNTLSVFLIFRRTGMNNVKPYITSAGFSRTNATVYGVACKDHSE